MALGDAVVQLHRVARDGDDEDEVEEQLEGGGGTPRLVRIAADDGAAERDGDDTHVASIPRGDAGHSGVSTASPLRFVTRG